MKEVSIRWFQYCLINCIIPTNLYLCKIQAKSSNTCTFCTSHVETIGHLFFECHLVRKVWVCFEKRLFERCKFVLKLTMENVLFGISPIKYNKALNTLIIWIKWMIYKIKLAGIRLMPQKILNELKNYFLYEKAILCENMKQVYFEKCWSNFINLFD